MPSTRSCYPEGTIAMTTSTLASAPSAQRRSPTRRTPIDPRRAAWARRAPAAARADLPDHRHAAAVRGDAGHLVPALERPRPGQTAAGPGLTTTGRCSPTPQLRDSVVTTIVLTATVVLVSLLTRARHRAAAGPHVPRPRRRAHPDDHAVPDRPRRRGPAVEARASTTPSYGLINGTLTGIWHSFGSDSPPQPDWLTDHPIMAVEAALVWQWTPFMMLILLAGLQCATAEVIEAAHVDGAAPWQIFRYITLPHMRQYLELGAPARLDLHRAELRRRLHDHLRRPRHGEPALHDLPDVLQRARLRPGLGAGVVVVVGTIIIATFALRTVSSLFQEETADDHRSSAASTSRVTTRGHAASGGRQRPAGLARLGDRPAVLPPGGCGWS